MKKTFLISLLLCSFAGQAQIAIPTGYRKKHYSDPAEQSMLSTVTNGRVSISLLALGRSIQSDDQTEAQNEALGIVFDGQSYAYEDGISYSKKPIVDKGKYYYKLYKENSLVQVTVYSIKNDAEFSNMFEQIKKELKDVEEVSFVEGPSKTVATVKQSHITPADRNADELVVFGMAIKKGAAIFIYNPVHQSPGVPWKYENIYLDIKGPLQQRPKLKGTEKVYAEINGFIKDPVSKDMLASVRITGTSIDLYINIEEAILSHEIEIAGTALKFVLYELYLSKQKKLTDDDIITFINGFNPPVTQLNEFDKKELISNYRKSFSSMIGDNYFGIEQVYFGVARVADYDFERGGFPVTRPTLNERYGMIGFATNASFDFPISGKYKGAAIEFRGISEKPFIPVSQDKEKKAIGQMTEDRQVYYKYYFKFKETADMLNKVRSGGQTTYGQVFTAIADVYEVEVYTDRHFKNKLATIKL